MSNVGLSMQENSAEEPREPRRRKPKRGRSGFVIFISLVVVLGLIGAVTWGAFQVIDRLEASAPAADYPGPGNEEVVITVEKGETLSLQELRMITHLKDMTVEDLEIFWKGYMDKKSGTLSRSQFSQGFSELVRGVRAHVSTYRSMA